MRYKIKYTPKTYFFNIGDIITVIDEGRQIPFSVRLPPLLNLTNFVSCGRVYNGNMYILTHIFKDYSSYNRNKILCVISDGVYSYIINIEGIRK